jgi:hypothetical protein
MHEAVKEGYGGEEVYEGHYHSTGDFGDGFFWGGALLDLQRGVEFGSGKV